MFATLTKRVTNLFETVKAEKSPKRPAFRPLLEGLEDRMLMAGNITATVDSFGGLIIKEAIGQAGLDNGVSINRLPSGGVRVRGIAATTDGSQSLINGAPFRDFNVTGSLFVGLGAGRDNVEIGTSGPISFDFVDINVTAGTESARRGGDAVFVTNLTQTGTAGQVNIATGNGNDFVTVTDSKIGGNLIVTMMRGNDVLDIKRTEANALTALMDVFRDTGRADDFGADGVLLENLIIKNSVSVVADPLVLADGSPALTGASDLIIMNQVSAGTLVQVSTAGGQDTVKLHNVRAVQRLNVFLGAGDDTLNLLHIRADAIRLEGEAGFDRLFMNDVVSGRRLIRGFEEILIPQVPDLGDNAGDIVVTAR